MHSTVKKSDRLLFYSLKEARGEFIVDPFSLRFAHILIKTLSTHMKKKLNRLYVCELSNEALKFQILLY